MKKSIICISTLLLYAVSAIAQQDDSPCGTTIPDQNWENEFQKLLGEFRAERQQSNTALTAYMIPVIFHVIHGGEPIGTFPNIDQGQISSQITVLNQDFSGSGFNSMNYPTNAFVNWAVAQSLQAANVDSIGRVRIADVNIQFCLAEKDTLGNVLPEPGIDRINYNSRGWTNPNSFTTTVAMRTYMNGTVKPQSIWNVAKYLNVWISDRSSSVMYTGFASMPPLSTLSGIMDMGTDSTDGIWCYSKTIGSHTIYPAGIYSSPLVEGRTLTHEAGHWLGLRHIWGDGACVTDYCADTPPAAAQNTGSPTYPLNTGSCNSPSNSPDGEMFMNFMDYPSDPNKYMFTTDQAIRMQTAMLNSPYRNQLGTHGLCAAPSGFDEYGIAELIAVYPNPSNSEVTITGTGHELVSVRIYNLQGELIAEHFTVSFSISDLTCGMYLIVVQTADAVFSDKLIRQ